MQTYLDLESIRLGDRLRVTQRVKRAALDRSVPTFSLQPLVENAVRHGIAPRADGGSIEIVATVAGDAVEITVTNDDAETPTVVDESGTGLRVLRERITALYQGRASVSGGPVDGRYHVRLNLPSNGS